MQTPKYNSMLGEHASLTEEDIVQLRLYGQPWVIELSVADDDFIVDITTVLHNTTNLFNVVYEHTFLTVSPRIGIKIVDHKKNQLGCYYTDKNYTAYNYR